MRADLALTMTMLLLALPAAAAEQEPPEAVTLLHDALAALQTGNHRQAEDLALQAATHPRQPQGQAWLVLAAAQEEAGQADLAADSLSRFLATNPGEPLKRYARRQLKGIRQPRNRQDRPSLDEQLSEMRRLIYAVVETETYVERSEHFVVHGRNKGLMQLIAVQAETAYQQICLDLFCDSNALATSADIYVWPDSDSFRQHVPDAPQGSLGLATLASGDQGHRIDLVQTDKDGGLSMDMLTRVLPHEICHLLTAEFLARSPRRRQAPAALPLAIEEGLAGLAESDAGEQRMAIAAAAAAAGKHIPLATLLDADHLEDVDDPQLFYAQSISVMAFLKERLGKRQFTRWLDQLRRGHDPAEAIQRTLASRTDKDMLEKLEDAWVDHVSLQAHVDDALAVDAEDRD
jgi:hypothetical protein